MKKRSQASLIIGIVIIGIIVLLAILAPWIAPNDPYEVNLSAKLQGFSAQYPLGTDQLGRCVLSRLLYGARTSLGAATVALAATFLLGSIMGFISGFSNELVDRVVMWICDVLLSFPGTLLALVIVGYFGSGMEKLIISIAAVSWAGYAINVRSMVMTQRNADYVKLAVAGGCSKLRIAVVHVLPNVIMPSLTLSVSGMIGKSTRLNSSHII